MIESDKFLNAAGQMFLVLHFVTPWMLAAGVVFAVAGIGRAIYRWRVSTDE